MAADRGMPTSAIASRLLRASEGGDAESVGEYLESLRPWEVDALFCAVEDAKPSEVDRAALLLRALISCKSVRPRAIASAATAIVARDLAAGAGERYLREALIGVVDTAKDRTVRDAARSRALSGIVHSVMAVAEQHALTRASAHVAGVALAAARAAKEECGSAEGAQLLDETVARILRWSWNADTCACLAEVLNTPALAVEHQGQLMGKIRAVVLAEPLDDAGYLLLMRQVLGMWSHFEKTLSESDWVELVRCLVAAPSDAVAGNLLCLLDIEMSSATAMGSALLRELDPGPSGSGTPRTARDLAIVLTGVRANDLYWESAMRVATNLLMLPHDDPAAPEAAGGSSAPRSEHAGRSSLLRSALSLPGMEASAGLVLELAQRWLSSTRATLRELGVDAIITIFAEQPQARDEVLSAALAGMAEVCNSASTGRSMLEVLRVLCRSHRATMREHLNLVQSWIDFIEEVPATHARGVMACLAPFAVLSPSFGDKLLIRLQKMATSHVATKRSLAVAGFLELLPHLRGASEDITELVLDGLTVALRKGDLALRAEICLGLSSAIGATDGLSEMLASRGTKLTGDLMARFRRCTDSKGFLDLEAVLYNVHGELLLREPLPELVMCLIGMGRASSLRHPVAQILSYAPGGERSTDEAPKELSPTASDLLAEVCLAVLNAHLVGAPADEARVLQAFSRLRDAASRKLDRKRRRESAEDCSTASVEATGPVGIPVKLTEHTASYLERARRCPSLSARSIVRLFQDLDQALDAEGIHLLFGLMLQRVASSEHEAGDNAGDKQKILQLCVRWLANRASGGGPRDEAEAPQGAPRRSAAKAKDRDEDESTRQKEWTPQEDDLRRAIRQSALSLLQSVLFSADLEGGQWDEGIAAAVEPLQPGDLELPLATAADAVLLAVSHQFQLDFAESMTLKMATAYLSVIQQLLPSASDAVLRNLGNDMLQILERFHVSQPSVLRGVLGVLYRSMEVDEALRFAKAVVLNSCARSDDEEERSRFTAMDDDILREGLAIEGIDQPCGSVSEWESRISKLGLTVDDKCRQCFLSAIMNFLAEASELVSGNSELAVNVCVGVTDALMDLLVLTTIRPGPRARKARAVQLPNQSLSMALKVVTGLLKHGTLRCKTLARGRSGASAQSAPVCLGIILQLVTAFCAKRSGGRDLRSLLGSICRRLPPGLNTGIRAKYQLERFTVAVQDLTEHSKRMQLDPTCEGVLANIKDTHKQGAETLQGSSNEPVDIAPLPPKRAASRKRRARSRNAYVDEWLHEEEGSDNYADLEDFLVSRDEVVEVLNHDENLSSSENHSSTDCD